MRPHDARAPEGSCGPRYEVADILRAHGEAYRATHSLTSEQRKVMWCVEACRTSVLGGHVEVCDDCGLKKPSYNSCRNRHCPKCQALDQARWIANRKSRILPVPYFHVVFTLPSELRTLAWRNPKHIYDLLFRTASKTLLELGRDPKRFGALLGITAVLHTWTRDLRLHPHLHCVVTGGGLHINEDRWVDSGPKYLFPVKVLGKLFRGKFTAGLDRLHRQGLIEFGESEHPDEQWDKIRDKLYGKRWVVYAKRPFAGPEQVYSYLGRYTHRVAISNYRIRAITDDSVTIDTRDGKTATMHPEQFIGRFLMHVLPPGFVKIRHYGLMASSHAKGKLKVAQQLLVDRVDTDNSAANDQALSDPSAQLPADWRQAMMELTGIDPTVCRSCGSRRLRRVPVPAQPRLAYTRSRAPPQQRAR